VKMIEKLKGMDRIIYDCPEARLHSLTHSERFRWQPCSDGWLGDNGLWQYLLNTDGLIWSWSGDTCSNFIPYGPYADRFAKLYEHVLAQEVNK
jgi:hypothetical protein